MDWYFDGLNPSQKTVPWATEQGRKAGRAKSLVMSGPSPIKRVSIASDGTTIILSALNHQDRDTVRDKLEASPVFQRSGMWCVERTGCKLAIVSKNKPSPDALVGALCGSRIMPYNDAVAVETYLGSNLKLKAEPSRG